MKIGNQKGGNNGDIPINSRRINIRPGNEKMIDTDKKIEEWSFFLENIFPIRDEDIEDEKDGVLSDRFELVKIAHNMLNELKGCREAKELMLEWVIKNKNRIEQHNKEKCLDALSKIVVKAPITGIPFICWEDIVRVIKEIGV